ncbi:hypothetical protein I7I50_06036 [Histoplasma capsulatum G186AR]|uniref:Uncharacterized protein n=1 Tax=Ajellomyces capsulatus TaxID=5037 RepID=A0A8H7YYK6_AJECA|nr:hypothetical protein I7I52_08774 [Histoplasma capsulatum]QSS67061.1 hypothetical protein I7I50_06036 [Histoplasma capsulatum G186AR]
MSSAAKRCFLLPGFARMQSFPGPSAAMCSSTNKSGFILHIPHRGRVLDQRLWYNAKTTHIESWVLQTDKEL